MQVESTIHSVKGFKVAGVHAGLKADNALDFALIYSEQPCAAAGVFTTNKVKAAPVLVNMEKLDANDSHIRAIAINTRCANACTGQQGIDNAIKMSQIAAESLNIKPDEVLVMSTGVIGTQLPMDKITRGVELAFVALGDDWHSAAQGIMTTDTRPKLASVKMDGYRIAGIAKGAGMIAPNMATMLGFLVTDAKLTPEQAQTALSRASDVTFNRIVVDGDMSTNDSVFLLANGASEKSIESDEELEQFIEALTAVSRQLAQDIVRDGEGVTKFITLSVGGAPSKEDARQIANAIATSPLVKTAFYGEDANWGRIIAAAGRSGVDVNPAQMHLAIKPGERQDDGEWLELFANGVPTDYDEARASAIMREPSIYILLDSGMGGDGVAVIWTCDLSHDYVSINGHYRS